MIVKDILKLILDRHYVQRGFSPGWGIRWLRKMGSDFFSSNGCSVSQKLWAYRHGFLSEKISDYKLTDENVSEFLSDREYLRLYPLNGRFGFWIDDKLTIRYVLSKFAANLPECYFLIENESIIKLMDAPAEFSGSFDEFFILLERSGSLALKKISGSCGEGFYVVAQENDNFFLNRKNISKKELSDFIDSLDGYIITEHLINHPDLAHIYPGTLNTLRIMGINKDGKSPQIVYSVVRFGSDRSGLVDNVSSGGFSSIVDLNTGEYGIHPSINRDKIKTHIHPDTNIPIEGIVPRWEEICSLLRDVMLYVPLLRWAGFDVAVTPERIIIVEINSHQDIHFMQNRSPLLTNKTFAEFLLPMLGKNRQK